MDRPQHLIGKLRHVSRKLHSFPAAQHQSRTCLARAQRGRGFGRVMSSWAWPCPLTWSDSSAKVWQGSAAPASAGKRETFPGSGRPPFRIANERTRTSGNGTTVTITATGQFRGSLPALGLDEQPRTPPGHFQPQTTGLEKTLVTFAYGANMNFVTLARRGVKVLSRDPAFVVDPAVQLVFKHQGGYATLERAEDGSLSVSGKDEPRFRPYDGRVHGVLYRITREDFEKLAKREGGYVVQEVQVRGPHTCALEANAAPHTKRGKGANGGVTRCTAGREGGPAAIKRTPAMRLSLC
ncbi:hypothetical protein Vafri_3547 [Volvox africanus]|uniref:gamma-glutamylcyclotransferase n=1 Tax=Volvox africanus TaxID=51714 RepID=A0A8J4AS40_9CHLO|nr:hypothetical protein Vafri_3547 [Volvox africanus]